MPTTNNRGWAVPLVCALLGLAFLAVFWISGDPGAGLGSLAVMVAYGLLLLLPTGRARPREQPTNA